MARYNTGGWLLAIFAVVLVAGLALFTGRPDAFYDDQTPQAQTEAEQTSGVTDEDADRSMSHDEAYPAPMVGTATESPDRNVVGTSGRMDERASGTMNVDDVFAEQVAAHAEWEDPVAHSID